MTRVVLLLAAMFCFAVSSRAAEPAEAAPDPAEVMKIMAQYGTPGAGHKQLEPLLGDWTYTCKMWMDPSSPPMESSGTIHRKWMLGNRFVHEVVEGTGLDGKPGFEGRGVIGYDNAQKLYTSAWICNMGTGVSTSKGTYDPSSKTFTFKREEFCPLRSKMIQGRDVVRIESNDKIVMETYETDNDQERKVLELVSVRKP